MGESMNDGHGDSLPANAHWCLACVCYSPRCKSTARFASDNAIHRVSDVAQQPHRASFYQVRDEFQGFPLVILRNYEKLRINWSDVDVWLHLVPR